MLDGLTGWMMGGLMGWLMGGLTGWMMGGLTGWLMGDIQILAKLVTAAGDEQQVFLDLEQPSARGADIYCAAAKAALNKTTTCSAALS